MMGLIASLYKNTAIIFGLTHKKQNNMTNKDGFGNF